MNPFLGEVRAVSFPFAPLGWALCDGTLMAIRSNTALFSLIGTQYGGDGIQTFGLPDFRGRVGTGSGQGPGLSDYVNGQESGTESYTLLSPELGGHTHLFLGSSDVATTSDPTAGVFASPNVNVREAQLFDVPADTQANAQMIAPAGNITPVPHENRGPVLAVCFIIALQGVFPARP